MGQSRFSGAFADQLPAESIPATAEMANAHLQSDGMSAGMASALQACSAALNSSKKQSTEAQAKVNHMNQVIEEHHAALDLVHRGFQKLASVDADYKRISDFVDDGAASSFRVEDLAQLLFPSSTSLNGTDNAGLGNQIEPHGDAACSAKAGKELTHNPIADTTKVDLMGDLQKQLALVQDQLKIKDTALQKQHQEAKEKIALLTSHLAAKSMQPTQGSPPSASPVNTEPGLGEADLVTSSVDDNNQGGRSPAQTPDNPNKRPALMQGGPAQKMQIRLRSTKKIDALLTERDTAKKEMQALVSGTSGRLQVRCKELMTTMLATTRSHTARAVLLRPWLVRRPWVPGDEDPGYPETTVGGHALRLYVLISGSGDTGFKFQPALGIIEKLVNILPHSHFKGTAVAYRSIMDAARSAHFEPSSVPLQRLFHFAILGLGNAIAARFGNMIPPSLFSTEKLNDTTPENLVDEVTRILRADPNNDRLYADLGKSFASCLRRYSAIVDKGPRSSVACFLAIPEQDYFVVMDFDASHILVVHRSMCGVEENPLLLDRKTFFVRSCLPGVQRIFIPALNCWGIEERKWWDSLVRSPEGDRDLNDPERAQLSPRRGQYPSFLQGRIGDSEQGFG